jgi:hypothetical protein
MWQPPPGVIAALNTDRATREQLNLYRAWNLSLYLNDGDRAGMLEAEEWALQHWRRSPDYDGKD